MFIELPQKTHTTYHRHIYALTCTSSTPQYLVWCKNTPPPSVCHKALKTNILHTCIQYKAKVSEHLTHFKSFHIISIGLRFSNITLKIFYVQAGHALMQWCKPKSRFLHHAMRTCSTIFMPDVGADLPEFSVDFLPISVMQWCSQAAASFLGVLP